MFAAQHTRKTLIYEDPPPNTGDDFDDFSQLTPPQLFAGKVKAYAGKDIDFSHYKTYEWFPPRVLTKAGVVEDHPANRILKEEVGRQLSQRGLNEVADGAELQIQIWVLTQSVPQIEAESWQRPPGVMYFPLELRLPLSAATIVKVRFTSV